MPEPRIDSITYSMRRGSPPRKLKDGDEKFVKGVLMVRQQSMYNGMMVVSNGRPVWSWVVWGSGQDRSRIRSRYRTLRNAGDLGALPVPAPPEGWKILESGRPIPAEHMTFCQPYTVDKGSVGWFGPTPPMRGREADVYGEIRAFAIRKTDVEMTREYFERGCICILEGKVRKQPASVSAAAAVKKYLARCKCSRHPEYSHAKAQ